MSLAQSSRTVEGGLTGGKVGWTDPAEGAVSVTPDDGVELWIRAIYVGGAGDLEVEMADGSEVIFIGLVAGMVYPFHIKRVKESLTTATDLVGLL